MDNSPPSRWLELVGTPLLTTGPGGNEVLAVNVAVRRLLGTMTLPPLPCPLDQLLGPDAGRAVRSLVGGRVPGQFGSSLTTDCEIAGERQRLTLHIASPPAPAEYWLITIMDPSSSTGPQAPRWLQNLQTIISWLPVGVEIVDQDMTTLYANAHVGELFGYTANEVGNFDDWLERAFPDPEYRALAVGTWQQGVAEARAADREMPPQEWDVVCKDGSSKTIQYRYRAVGDFGVILYHDVTNERKLAAELRGLANTDALTGLYNRRHFFRTAAAWCEAAQADKTDLSVLFLDLDHFKSVNDRHGHAVGDSALQAVAEQLRQTLRAEDLVARLGGEEFAVLLRETSRAEAERVAERLRAAIANPEVPIEEPFRPLTISIGGATRRPHEQQVTSLIERADRSLYLAKRAGRNCVRFEDTQTDTLERSRISSTRA